MEEQCLNNNHGIKTGLTPADLNYLKWLKRKHSQSPVFAQQLVNCCATDFRKHANLTDDQRAEIYKKHREVLSQKYDAGLRKHAKIHCNS